MKIIIPLIMMTALLIAGCTTQDINVKVKYYDANGNLLGTQDVSNQLTQATIPLNNMPSGTVMITYVIRTRNTGEVPLTVNFTQAKFVGEYQ